MLCIDNEDSILLGLRSLLGRWGCQVWTAPDRATCEALLDEGHRPHLALVDCTLERAIRPPARGFLRAAMTPAP